MDRVKAAEPIDGESGCGVEQHIIEPHELDSFDDLTGASSRGWPVVPDRSDHFDAGERTRRSSGPSPHERAERSGLRLLHHELHER